MCQEISDLREGQLLALCRQPGVGAVIYLLYGAASVEVSMENTPGEQSAGAAEHTRASSWERRHFRVAGFGVLAACLYQDPPNPPGWLAQEPSTYREARKKLGSEKMKRSAEVPGHLTGHSAGARAVMGHCPTAV